MSGWTDALGVVEKLAPVIATCVGGPLAGGALSALEGVFGLTPQPSASTDDRQSAIAAAISGATPEQLAAMRAKDQDYALGLAQAGFKDTETLAALTVQDTQSARSMQVADKSTVPAVLTYALVFGFFGMLVMLCFVTVPVENRTIVYSFVTTLGVLMPIAAHFWFGSTQSSGRMSDQLAQSQPLPPAK